MKRFIPNRQAAKLAKTKQMHDVLSATGADPTHYGLTAAEVTELGTLLTAAQGASADSVDSKEFKKSKTNAFSGTGQSLDQLMAKVADCGNKIRVSDATDDEVLATGADRPKPVPRPSRRHRMRRASRWTTFRRALFTSACMTTATPVRAPAPKTPSARKLPWWMPPTERRRVRPTRFPRFLCLAHWGN